MNSKNKIYVYPTDTVWGIGCTIFSEELFLKIAQIKKTSSDKPLSILFTSKSELREYFDLPPFMDDHFLKLFENELTILISKKYLKKEFPNYLLKLSDFISVRLIENMDELKKMRQEIGAPFFTTSLNITGEPPIIDSQKARDFFNSFCPDAIFVQPILKPNQQALLSGKSSTIIKLNSQNKFEFIRDGQSIASIKNYLSALNLL